MSKLETTAGRPDGFIQCALCGTRRPPSTMETFTNVRTGQQIHLCTDKQFCLNTTRVSVKP